jgi:hypothetical protein
MATYRFNYLTNENNSLEENYESSENIKNVKSAFINYKGNVMSIQRIDILIFSQRFNCRRNRTGCRSSFKFRSRR